VSRVKPAEAIAELKELSTQIEAVVLSNRDGHVVASSLGDVSAGRVAATATSLLSGADELGRDMGRDSVSQLQAATPGGSVFCVLDGDRVAIATTGNDPTVGLVFYDLKTLLRQTAGDAVAAAEQPTAGAAPSQPAASDTPENAPDAEA
jgi:predicted regulator of Ras-like GTPase activity (Roadblock/LC7/MglB family)